MIRWIVIFMKDVEVVAAIIQNEDKFLATREVMVNLRDYGNSWWKNRFW